MKTARTGWTLAFAAVLMLLSMARAGEGGPSPLAALPSLDVPAYMGTWYQVAWFPNRFQHSCDRDTQATYRLLGDGQIEVVNRCRRVDGSVDGISGVARPVGQLQGARLLPAQIEVSFLPRWLRWLPIGWADYWVVHLAADGRYAIVSEPSRQYLWILARTPSWSVDDDAEVRGVLQRLGFDLARLERHPQREPLP